jgi:8-oxo-dGTP diphosphatase
MPYEYDHPRPMVTADTAIFRSHEGRLEVLLIQRGKPPFKGSWALPGGFVEMEEDLEDAARRELGEETGLSAAWMEQLKTFGRPGRDPRGRVITVVYLAVAPAGGIEPRAGDDAARAAWFDPRNPPPLAFDHAEVLACALARLRERALDPECPLRPEDLA